MKYVILEDEKIAARRLRSLIEELRPEYRQMVQFDSVESACISLPALKPDLLFMDIQLADGLSFEILDQVQIESPIIFTTAYDQYAIRAFKSNSIDYLLKPLDSAELEIAIEKFEKQRQTQEQNYALDMEKLRDSMQPGGKERFIVRLGDHLKPIQTADVQLIYSKDKTTYLLTSAGRHFPIDYSVEKVENLLDPKIFKKISRKYIININFIKDIIAFTNSRLEVLIDHFEDEQIIVAREKVNDFKSWIDR